MAALLSLALLLGFTTAVLTDTASESPVAPTLPTVVGNQALLTDADLFSLRIEFSEPTNRGNAGTLASIPCGTYFVIQPSLFCRWESATVLVLLLEKDGVPPTDNSHGFSFDLRPDVIRSLESNLAVAATTITVVDDTNLPSTFPLNLKFETDADCTTTSLFALPAVNLLSIGVQWTASYQRSGDAVPSVLAPSSSPLFDFGGIYNGMSPGRTLRINLTGVDWLGRTASGTVSTGPVGNQPLFVALSTPPAPIFPNQRIKIAPVSVSPLCAAAPSVRASTTYFWTQVAGPTVFLPGDIVSQAALVLPPNSLTSDASYTFQLSVTVFENDVLVSSGAATATFYVAQSPLVAVISGGDAVAPQGAGHTLTSLSYDPDDNVAPTLLDSWSWSCQNLLTALPCATPTGTDLSFTLPASTPVGAYSIVLTVARGSRTASTSTLITVSSSASVQASLRAFTEAGVEIPNHATISWSQQLTFVAATSDGRSVSWTFSGSAVSQASPSFTLRASGSNRIHFLPGAFQSDAIFANPTVTLTATAPFGTGQASFTWTIARTFASSAEFVVLSSSGTKMASSRVTVPHSGPWTPAEAGPNMLLEYRGSGTASFFAVFPGDGSAPTTAREVLLATASVGQLINVPLLRTNTHFLAVVRALADGAAPAPYGIETTRILVANPLYSATASSLFSASRRQTSSVAGSLAQVDYSEQHGLVDAAVSWISFAALQLNEQPTSSEADRATLADALHRLVILQRPASILTQSELTGLATALRLVCGGQMADAVQAKATTVLDTLISTYATLLGVSDSIHQHLMVAADSILASRASLSSSVASTTASVAALPSALEQLQVLRTSVAVCDPITHIESDLALQHLRAYSFKAYPPAFADMILPPNLAHVMLPSASELTALNSVPDCAWVQFVEMTPSPLIGEVLSPVLRFSLRSTGGLLANTLVIRSKLLKIATVIPDHECAVWNGTAWSGAGCTLAYDPAAYSICHCTNAGPVALVEKAGVAAPTETAAPDSTVSEKTVTAGGVLGGIGSLMFVLTCCVLAIFEKRRPVPPPPRFLAQSA